ncbi:hypothetical protein KUV85_00280 [Nocardioides panacisoli]|uniref:hypothetical protein n=1 Tax=Nocardioides panacisoli TaxID=627624 RepID=UPI001C62ABD2|nr:hypothetical protein [Nocardioides panacisoli]QYJ04151.1 hypothetical protein KUV85_00280 [Nocardioides panacisoli]
MVLQLLIAAEEGPDANDVVAGWTGLIVLLAMVAAVAFLGWSLTKQLKKADRAAQEGVYDDPAERGGSGTDR